MRDLNLAIIQTHILWEDPKGNYDHFLKKINEIEGHPDLIILPEMFTTGFPVDPEKFAEHLNGPTMKWMQQVAAEKDCVLTGSYLIENKGKNYNCLVWMRPDGSFETYYKRHVFHLGLESETISQGAEKLLVELKGWKISPMICYDLRFPVWSKNHYRDGKYHYDLLIFVANWPEVRNYPWKQLLLARAIDNQSYVIGLNRVGTDDNGISYSGDSAVVDPQGKIVAAAEAGKDSVLTATLSYGKMKEFREKFTVGADWDDFEILPDNTQDSD